MESSSEYETSQSENEDTGLNLTQVNEMVKEYEKELKKDRKKNANRNENIGEILIDPEMLAKIKISQNQLKKLKPKKPRSEKQIESAKRMLDIRRNKLAEAKAEKEQKEALKLQVMEKRAYNKKKKEEEVFEFEEEDVERVEENKPRGKYQARKPKLDDDSDEEIEKKVDKINKINNVINNPNPYYALIMAKRGIKI